jgi:DNA repair protein RadC
MMMNDKEQRISIKQWAVDDRPREKLMNKGIESLSDAELIAVLIGSGTGKISAVDLAKNILHSVKYNLIELGKLSVHDLQKHKGIGEAKAVSIVAAIELGKRRKISEVIEKKRIGGSKDVFDIFGPMLGDLPHEEFRILLLSRSNKIIKTSRISSGGISGTVTDIKIIMKEAVLHSASGIIVCHNHPSGNIKPSENDIEITKKIKNACISMEISFLDHLIVSFSEYYSFADEGLI